MLDKGQKQALAFVLIGIITAVTVIQLGYNSLPPIVVGILLSWTVTLLIKSILPI